MERDSREEAFSALPLILGSRGREKIIPASGDGTDSLSPLASELGYGTVRHLARLDWLIERHAGRRKEKIDAPVLNILRLAFYQAVYLPSIPGYALVSESVELAKRRTPRAAGFVNWVLRRIGPETKDLPRRGDIPGARRWLAIFYSFPPWMVNRWADRFGEEETEALLGAMNTFPPLDLRVNLLRSDRPGLQAELEGLGGAVLPGRFSPSALHLTGLRRVTTEAPFREGRFYIQDESSQLPSLALAPAPGETILDACAGVGGKATHLAEIAGGEAAVTAMDADGDRLDRLRENAARLGHDTLRAKRGDLLDRDFDPGGPFDGIVVDVPCSGLGIIRRHPELKWAKESADPARLARRQLNLLTRAASLLRPGGRLVYSTCTIEPEENEEVVAEFLGSHGEFHLLPLPADAIDSLEELLTPDGFISTFPHRHGLNGSFTALLARKAR